jgi:hypothetical protein
LAAACRFSLFGCRIHWFLNLNPSGAAAQVAWWVGQECLVGRKCLKYRLSLRWFRSQQLPPSA